MSPATTPATSAFPVYLYASGGAPERQHRHQHHGHLPTATGGTYTYTFTAGNQLYTGQSVQFSSSSLAGKWATLNGTTQTVLATPSASSFQISTTIAPGAGANTQNGSIAAVGAVNPAIVNMAMLGICPGVGNFTKTIRWVYMNEVSTAAMAYAIAGFATDSVHIGTSTSNETGLQNAALNAASLYNIQGGRAWNSQATALQAKASSPTRRPSPATARSFRKRSSTPSATSLQPASTRPTPPPRPPQPAPCSSPTRPAPAPASGVKPIDIATAAINMAHNPGAANVVALLELPSGGTVPFAPQLTSAPNDFTVAITYNNITAPGSIAIDASGNAFVPTNSSSGYVTEALARRRRTRHQRHRRQWL